MVGTYVGRPRRDLEHHLVPLLVPLRVMYRLRLPPRGRGAEERTVAWEQQLVRRCRRDGGAVRGRRSRPHPRRIRRRYDRPRGPGSRDIAPLPTGADAGADTGTATTQMPAKGSGGCGNRWGQEHIENRVGGGKGRAGGRDRRVVRRAAVVVPDTTQLHKQARSRGRHRSRRGCRAAGAESRHSYFPRSLSRCVVCAYLCSSMTLGKRVRAETDSVG